MWVALATFVVALLATMLAVAGPAWPRSVGIVLLTMVVGTVAGGAIGFLFGIPRVLTDAAAAPAAIATAAQDTVGDQAEAPVAKRRVLSSNSNLEQVSDWLTKIILGVGLTQLYQLNGKLSEFRLLVGSYSPPADTTTPLVSVIVLVFSVLCGFLAMYLETRLVLSRVFDSVERELAEATAALARQKKRTESAQSLASDLQTVVKTIATSPGKGGASLAAAADSLKTIAQRGDVDSAIRSVAVSALAASGRSGEAETLIPRESQSVTDQISKMQLALYEPAPVGFQKAIETGAALDASAAARALATYWFFYAAAFGQKHKYVRETGGSAEDLQSARDNALDCVRRCLAIDPAYATWIRNLMEPEKSPTPQDDDLSDFRNDPDFAAVIDVTARRF